MIKTILKGLFLSIYFLTIFIILSSASVNVLASLIHSLYQVTNYSENEAAIASCVKSLGFDWASDRPLEDCSKLVLILVSLAVSCY